MSLIHTPPRRRDQMKRFGPFVLLVVSLIASIWYYLGDDVRTSKLLISKPWQSHMVNRIEESNYRGLEGITRTDQHTHMVFLPDNTYSRVTQIVLKNEVENTRLVMSVSEAGKWEVSGDYLKLSLDSLKDVTTGDTSEFSEDDLAMIRTFYRIGAEKVRRIDVLPDGSLLLTSLNYGSLVLYSQNTPQ